MPIPDGMVSEPVVLGPHEVVAERPFTAVELTERDVSVLYRIVADVCAVLTDAAAGRRTIVPYEQMAWRVGGLVRRLIICDERRLRLHPRLCAVGFFGERRPDPDPGPLEEANSAIVAEFVRYPGILSYASIELPGHQWANMVLHDDPIDTSYWRQSELHAQAVAALSPLHYENVRLHNARLTAGLFDAPLIAVERTKYYDYAGDSEWRARREYLE